MNAMELGDTGLRAPQLGFGCSAVLGRAGRTASLCALNTAWDEGIRFFDTARSYGYGEAEGLLGEFLRGRREQAVIATKFGILPARQPGWKQLAKSAARGVLALAPSAHTMLRRRAASQFSANRFTIPVLHESIEASLRSLSTDRVDILFLHAAPASVLEQDELLGAMQRLIETGKVRIAGLSAAPDVVELALNRNVPPLRAMQFPCNVFEPLLTGSKKHNHDCVLVANQPFGGTVRVQECRARLQSLVRNDAVDPALREKLDSMNDELFADVVLNTIVCGTGIHVAIPAMMRPEHIRANVKAVRDSRFGAEEIVQIREALVRGT